MSAPIEQGFVPQTVNELLLLERIHELRIANYANGPSFDPVPRDALQVHQIQPMLTLAADLKAGWENDHRYAVTAEARTADQGFHMGYYLSREMMLVWTKRALLDQLSKMHLTMIRNMTASLKD